MSIKGSLDDVPLSDIIQLVSMSGKTGAFVLKSPSQVGKIFLRDGQIVHAQLGGLGGEDAFLEIASWQEGSFAFEENLHAVQPSIQRSSTSLLMEAARRADEWQVLSKHIPSIYLIPALTDRTWSTSVSFSPQEWSVICKIDRRRSIDEIASGLGIPASEVCKLLYGLVTTGLVELRDLPENSHSERLAQMSRSELAVAAQGIHEQARALFAGHDRLAELDATGGHLFREIQSGKGVEAVTEMIQSIEQLVSSTFGVVHARAFSDKIKARLGE